jgi:hypothetical protein
MGALRVWFSFFSKPAILAVFLENATIWKFPKGSWWFTEYLQHASFAMHCIDFQTKYTLYSDDEEWRALW